MLSPLFCSRTPPTEIRSLILRCPLSVMNSRLNQGHRTTVAILRARISTTKVRKHDQSASRTRDLPDISSSSRILDKRLTEPPGGRHDAETSVRDDAHAHETSLRSPMATPPDTGIGTDTRLPRSVQALYLKPLKRKAEYGVPCCDLQLRSYSVRNVEFMADFALRAAYYLGLPAAGPIPLPRITERWTVPRSNFIFKKSQENFERVTLRRLIQIQDGYLDTVEIWLAFLRKHAYYGVGMKANVWQYEKLGVGKTMDVSLANLKRSMEPQWAHLGERKTQETSERAYQMMSSESYKADRERPLRNA